MDPEKHALPLMSIQLLSSQTEAILDICTHLITTWINTIDFAVDYYLRQPNCNKKASQAWH